MTTATNHNTWVFIMAKYDATITLKVSGHSDEIRKGVCPDESCYLDCVAQARSAFGSVDSHRRGNPHDAAAAKSGAKTHKIVISAVVKCDGKPHVEDVCTFHDVPDTALPAIRSALQTFCSHPTVAAVLKP